jgi:hypothetical protein
VAATPALAGHAAVHQHHVRDQLLDQGDGGLAGVGLAHHLPAADLLEQGAQHRPGPLVRVMAVCMVSLSAGRDRE